MTHQNLSLELIFERKEEFLNHAHDSEPKDEIAEITEKTATQEQTWYGNEICCGPKHAIDKNLSTAIVVESTENGTGWLRITFNKTHFIHKVIIYYSYFETFREDSAIWCGRSLENFQFCVNRDSNVDVSVYKGEVKQKSCGTLQLSYGLERSDQIYEIVCNTEGNSVVLSKSTGIIIVFEVVITSTGKSQNIALMAV